MVSNVDDFVFELIGNDAYMVLICSTTLETIIVPSTYNGKPVICIGNDAFCDCTSIKKIEIPNSVISIGNNAFARCRSLKTITLPNSLMSIGEGAFCDCTSLEKIEIPNSITTIGTSTFYGCSSLISITIPDSVTKISAGAFFGCSSLRSIGGDDFCDVTLIKKIESVGKGKYLIQASLSSITIPDSVTNIGEGAFGNCSSLTNIIIPKGVTSIGKGAFLGCNLTKIEVSDNNPVYDSRNNCNAVIETSSNTLILGCRNTIIPNGTTSIGDCAFNRCSSLKEITIPNSVEKICDFAFCGCGMLEKIILSDNLTSIGECAFFGCSSLKEITVPNSVKMIGSKAFYFCRLVYIDEKWNNRLDVNPFNIVYEKEGLQFKLSDNEMYYSVVGYKGKNTNLVIPSIYKGKPVLTINSNAFSGCSSLKKIIVPNSVTSIGEGAFCKCGSLENITLPFIGSTPKGTENTNFGYIFGANSYLCNSDYVPLSLKEVTITNATSIQSNAFFDCCSIESIQIFDSATSIGEGAFLRCKSLKNIIIPDSVTSIGQAAFADCVSLTCITIPNSVTSIGKDAFSGCSLIQSITIPNKVTSIVRDAFSRCNLLGIKVDENNAFYDSRNNCNAIIETKSNSLILGCRNTIIPKGTTSIGDWAFNRCSTLESIIVPSSITSIGSWAFSGCVSLKTIYYTGTKEQWGCIFISRGNDELTNANIIFNYVEE